VSPGRLQADLGGLPLLVGRLGDCSDFAAAVAQFTVSVLLAAGVRAMKHSGLSAVSAAGGSMGPLGGCSPRDSRGAWYGSSAPATRSRGS